MNTPPLKYTPLIDIHEKHGAKFGAFAGYKMPLFYKAGIIKEHLHTRQSAGLFDISHMMFVEISGAQTGDLISTLCPVHGNKIPVGHGRYTFFLNENGGIIDDLIVSCVEKNRFSLVCNAGSAQKDWAHITHQTQNFSADARIVPYGLIALQGPNAAKVLEGAGLNVNQLDFMQNIEVERGSGNWLISRSGYTGEDGFELAIPEIELPKFSEQLLADQRVLPIGLGARDSLRLEAGLSLYGQDLSDKITPMEAGLTWAIPKDLRDEGRYIGAQAIAQHISKGRERKRVGLKPDGRAPVRAGSKILDKNAIEIGEITSGGFGPSVEHPVALGLINADADCEGLVAEVRGKHIALNLATLPFNPHNYKR